jgi:hypothetical protein
MRNDWILDVLADLKAFARDNGLRELAEQLDDAQLVAGEEISRAARSRSLGAQAGACEGHAEGVRDGH